MKEEDLTFTNICHLLIMIEIKLCKLWEALYNDKFSALKVSPYTNENRIKDKIQGKMFSIGRTITWLLRINHVLSSIFNENVVMLFVQR